jgi:hypothetical protein
MYLRRGIGPCIRAEGGHKCVCGVAGSLLVILLVVIGYSVGVGVGGGGKDFVNVGVGECY